MQMSTVHSSNTDSFRTGDDPIVHYLREIRDIPLLSRADEVQMASAIEAYRTAFLTSVIEIPEAGDTLVALWRQHRDRGHSTAPMASGYRAGSRPKDLERQINERLSALEALTSERAALPGDACDRRRELEDQIREKLDPAAFSLRTFEDLRRRLKARARTRSASAPERFRNQVEAMEAAWNAWGACKNRFAQHNLRLVASVARDFAGSGLPLLDLIQEGNLGLLRAIDRFDYKRGFKFSTYALYWIRQALARAVQMQSRTIRIPSHAQEAVRAMRRAQSELQLQLGRELSLTEVADLLGYDQERTDQALHAAEWQTVRADAIAADPDAMDLWSTIPDDGAVSPSADIEQQMLRHTACDCVDSLEGRDRAILRWRFGLDGEEPLSLETIGERLGITRERVRQLETRALVRLRQSRGSAALAEFV